MYVCFHQVSNSRVHQSMTLHEGFASKFCGTDRDPKMTFAIFSAGMTGMQMALIFYLE
jgi:hypothetical protein